MTRNYKQILIEIFIIISVASVVMAKPYPASEDEQRQPTKSSFIVDPIETYKLGPAIGTLPLDPTGTYKMGSTSFNKIPEILPSRAKREAEPNPTFFTARYIPDGIYSAGGVYPAYGPTGVNRLLRPTGIFTTGGATYRY